MNRAQTAFVAVLGTAGICYSIATDGLLYTLAFIVVAVIVITVINIVMGLLGGRK